MALSIIAMLAAGAVAGSVCLVSEPTADSRIFFVTSPEVEKKIARSALKRAECPQEFSWTLEAAKDLCAVYVNYSDEMRAGFTELYKVSPIEVCKAGLSAAGMKVNMEERPSAKQ